MRKTAAVLSFLLACGFLIAFAQMKLYDTDHAADDTRHSFDQIHARQYAAFQDDLNALDARHTEEGIYGIAGLIAGIAGFALWPTARAKTASTAQQVA